MVGGILVETWGAKVTFWIFAIASFLQMLLFLLIQKVGIVRLFLCPKGTLGGI